MGKKRGTPERRHCGQEKKAISSPRKRTNREKKSLKDVPEEGRGFSFTIISKEGEGDIVGKVPGKRGGSASLPFRRNGRGETSFPTRGRAGEFSPRGQEQPSGSNFLDKGKRKGRSAAFFINARKGESTEGEKNESDLNAIVTEGERKGRTALGSAERWGGHIFVRKREEKPQKTGAILFEKKTDSLGRRRREGTPSTPSPALGIKRLHPNASNKKKKEAYKGQRA